MAVPVLLCFCHRLFAVWSTRLFTQVVGDGNGAASGSVTEDESWDEQVQCQA